MFISLYMTEQTSVHLLNFTWFKNKKTYEKNVTNMKILQRGGVFQTGCFKVEQLIAIFLPVKKGIGFKYKQQK